MNNYTVYVHINKANGLRYVGITAKPVETRWKNGAGYHKQSCFYNAIQKYGWDGFEHVVLAESMSKEAACAEEEKLIALWNTTDRQHGYNRSTGGEAGASGVQKSPLQLKTSSQNMKSLWASEEFRERKRHQTIEMNKRDDIKVKRSAANSQRTVSEETKKKISQNRKGKGLHRFSAEHIQHIKDNHAGGSLPRRVMCIETGEIFESINDAARAKGTYKRGVSNCCRGVLHYNTAGGFHWKFATEER